MLCATWHHVPNKRNLRLVQCSFGQLIASQIKPAVTSFSASEFCWQPALGENQDCFHYMSIMV